VSETDMQQEIDKRNRQFWNELCGTGLAQSLGIEQIDEASLARFDTAYLDIYPYLEPYVDRLDLPGKDVLEIGLGFGTLGQVIASRGGRYHGLDISPGPVAMMQDRLRMIGGDPERVVVGSALEIPWPDETFDSVVSIGCLHHTGDLRQSIDEVWRVLRPSGRALVMLYNKHSFRQLTLLGRKAGERLRNRDGSLAEYIRGRYDANRTGEAAPHTDYVSVRDVRRLFGRFSSVRVDRQNFDTYSFTRFGRHVVVERARLLTNVARVAGLDLYIDAVK
jgi:SAM-dependent methyltransferase